MPIQYITLKNDQVLIEQAEVSILGITTVHNNKIWKQGYVRLISAGITQVAENDRVVFKTSLQEEKLSQGGINYTIIPVTDIRFVYTEPIL